MEVAITSGAFCRLLRARISCFPAIFVEKRGFASSLLDIRAAASGDDCQSAATAAADMMYASDMNHQKNAKVLK